MNGTLDPLSDQFDLDGLSTRLLQADRTATIGAINYGLEQNPDHAAEADQISHVTGDNPVWIADNLDDYKADLKRRTAQELVLNNPALVDYVQSHPLASAISSDDWHSLDRLSEHADGFFGALGKVHDYLNAPFQKAAEGIVEGAIAPWRQGTEVSESDAELMDFSKHPLAAGPARAAYGLVDILSKIVMSGMGAVEGGASGSLQTLGASPEESHRMVETGFNAAMAFPHVPMEGIEAVAPRMPKPQTPMDLLKPWVDAGVEPPAGIHPAIDAAKAQVNQAFVDDLEALLQTAGESTTRERAPDMISALLNKHPDYEVGIHADAVLALYGDKLPEPNDGLLGWVPDIATKLEHARELGSDVTIPVKDLVAKMDPAVAKGLRDDMRMWPGAVTARELAEAPIEPKEIIAEPGTQLKASAGLEPKFSLGDRKLTLKQGAIEAGDQFHPEVHNFELTDEKGQAAGNMEIIPGPDKKTLYVNWIGGEAGKWANSFGPALIRDLKRQLKEAYPEYEYLTGHRVSGARERANDFGPMPLPKVKLSEDLTADDYARAQEIFTQAGWRQVSDSLVAAPVGAVGLDRQHLGDVIEREVQKLTGGSVDTTLSGDIAFTKTQQMAGGAYLPDYEKRPEILINLMSADPLGTARHESIHQLREYNFLSDKEWSTLEQAAQAEGWMDRFGIHERYATLDNTAKLEEAIADGFREWAAQAPEVRPKTGVGAVFQKIMDLFDRIKTALGFGPEASWEQVFERIQSGEVGARGPGESRSGAMDLRPKLSAEDERKAITEGLGNLQAQSVGLPKDSYGRLLTAMEEQRKADLAKAESRALREQTKRQSAEWKENRSAMVKEVGAEIRQRPDVAADLFIGSGEFGGKKLQQRYTLSVEDLTPEQKAMLPEHYVSKNGLPVDQVANLFGYGSKDELVSALGALEATKRTPDGKRMQPLDFMRKLIGAETDRRMEQRYGNLQANIMSDALDQALSDSQINVMHEELRAAADAAGVLVPGKDEMLAHAKELVGQQTVGTINSWKTMQVSARISRAIDQALLAKDFATATPLLQQRALIGMVANEARKVEKEIKTFDKTAARMAKREQKSMEPEYTNWVHDILMRIGKKVKRGPADLAREIEASGSGATLGEFVENKAEWLRELAVWDELHDGSWSKPYKDMSVTEFRAVKASVDSLIANGRDERRIMRAGTEEDFDLWKSEAIENVQQFKAKDQTDGGKTADGAWWSKAPRTFLAHSLQLENVLGRWDRYDKYGAWTQGVMRALTEGSNKADAWKKEYAKRLGALKDKADLREQIPNPIFKAPERYGGGLLKMDRGNLRAVILNLGNKSNLMKMAKGWDVEPRAIWNWAMTHGKKEDFDFAQGVWDLLSDIKDETDKMYRNLSGVPPESIEPWPVVTKHGTYKGGYYPVIFHETFEGSSYKLKGNLGLKGEGYESAVTPAGHTKSRVKYYAPLSMELDQLPNRISSMVHDNALRPAVINAGKVFRNHEIRAAITTHYGKEYTDMLVPWLRGVANASNAVNKDAGWFTKYSDFMRQNVITTLIAFNPGTVMKHGPTAAVLSAREVGLGSFAKAFADTVPSEVGRRIQGAVRGLFGINDETSESNWQFAKKHSLELQRRDRNWQETLYGATGELTQGAKFGEWRQRIMEWGSKPVALSDMISAVPTWLAAYRKAMEEHGNHGDAVWEADRSVRRAHGSMAQVNRPHLTNYTSPWLTSVYNFFNDIMNRQVETLWKAGDAVGLAKDGQKKAAMAMVPGLAASAFAYAIWPAITENWVSPIASEPHDSWAKKAAEGMIHTLGASWVGIREIANAIEQGKDPDVGMLTTAGRMLMDEFRDVRKDRPFAPEHAQKLIRDTAQFAGFFTGMVPKEAGNLASFTYGVAHGQEHPRGPWGWMVGARFGTTKGHSQTFEDYLAGRYDRRK